MRRCAGWTKERSLSRHRSSASRDCIRWGAGAVPYLYGSGLNQDETAIATFLAGMERYLSAGRRCIRWPMLCRMRIWAS